MKEKGTEEVFLQSPREQMLHFMQRLNPNHQICSVFVHQTGFNERRLLEATRKYQKSNLAAAFYSPFGSAEQVIQQNCPFTFDSSLRRPFTRLSTRPFHPSSHLGLLFLAADE